MGPEIHIKIAKRDRHSDRQTDRPTHLIQSENQHKLSNEYNSELRPANTNRVNKR